MKYIRLLSVLSLTALVSVGAIFAWSRAHRAPATSSQTSAAPPPSRRTSNLQPFVLPPEPQAPEKGTAGRKIFLDAMIAGDERGLATVRKALSDSQAGIRSGTDPSREELTKSPQAVRQLRLLEQTYRERLERHRLELAAEP